MPETLLGLTSNECRCTELILERAFPDRAGRGAMVLAEVEVEAILVSAPARWAPSLAMIREREMREAFGRRWTSYSSVVRWKVIPGVY